MANRRFATRLNSFREPGGRGAISHEELARVAAVPGITAVELNYPQHVHHGERELFSAIAAMGLEVTALNLRFDERVFARGAFTNPDPDVRAAAVHVCQDAVTIASQTGVDHVILWLGPDGFDFPFQVDVAQLWNWEVEGLRQVAETDDRVRVSIEYKPSEPRRVSLPEGVWLLRS